VPLRTEPEITRFSLLQFTCQQFIKAGAEQSF
jgi:hypothetical protein